MEIISCMEMDKTVRDMRIIHTSDWHLGQVLFNYDRREEQRFFLEQLEWYVKEMRPDALVVSGDIYNTSMPSAATQKMFTDAVLSVHRACPETVVVITGGNHDSAPKLEIDKELWKEVGVHVVGRLQYADASRVDYAGHIVEVPGKGYIAAVPHVYPQNFPYTGDGADRQAAFFRKLLAEVVGRNREDLPVVLMAHLTVANADLTGHNRYLGGIGNIEEVPLETFGGEFDYLALGHIHRGQTIRDRDGIGRARYCGSPIAVSFDEEYDHSLSLVEVERGKEARLTRLPVANLHPLMTLPKEPVAFEQAIRMLREMSFDHEPYVRLNVSVTDGLPTNCNELAHEAAAVSGCRFCTFKVTNQADEADRAAYIDMTPDELKGMNPMEIAERYMRGQGISFEAYEDMMKDVFRALEEEERG